MVIARTDRLTLRRLTLDDAGDLFRIYSDPLVMRFMGTPPASVDEETANIEAHLRNSYDRHGFGMWAVVLNASGEVIGRSGLIQYESQGQQQTEIGYLLDRRYWGKGYATEAGAAVVRFAFDELGIDRLVAMIAPTNTASMRVAQRLRFRPAGAVDYKTFGLVDLYIKERGESVQ